MVHLMLLPPDSLTGDNVLCCECFVRKDITEDDAKDSDVMGIISMTIRIYKIITFVHFQTTQD